ncbi:MAG: pyruvate, phosphate dikinase [Nitrospiraceae bacterium]|nr:pyruvate, phosphate dikinase [Nitrospiraceae bacterium]
MAIAAKQGKVSKKSAKKVAGGTAKGRDSKAAAGKKWIYFFGMGKADGQGGMKDLLGGKGAGLAEMSRLGLPVPAGFSITTEACNAYFDHGKRYPSGMWDQVLGNLKKVEKAMGMKFGDSSNPLLVSVRSGAKFSMPGMMDTVLNLGLNKDTLQGIIKKTGNERFAYDAYRRFIGMFGSIVMGINKKKFECALDAMKHDRGVSEDTGLNAEDLKKLVGTFKAIYRKETGSDFPEDPFKQLEMAINAVFGSWFGDRAIKYRSLNDIPHNLGTACNVQTMVFGNMGDDSGTGVGFTRDPSTGQKRFFAECLINAQGEDVVAGIRTPMHIDELKKRLPKAYKTLDTIYKKLEKHYKDMLDLEFTVQEGQLYMLQTRVGKRTARAALKIAIDLVKEKQIDRKTALLRLDPQQLDQLLHPMVDPNIDPRTIMKLEKKGLPASPGAAVGKVVFNAEDAENWAKQDEKVILVRPETSPEDIGGMHAAQGILTARGGMTSHAAVVARGMGKCCVAGAGSVYIDEEKKIFTTKVKVYDKEKEEFMVKEMTVKEGDFITLNGSTGEVMLGEAPLVQPEITKDFTTIMKWADETRKIGVWANADTPKDARTAMGFGAEGIGLCRTEHMFFEPERIKAVREMILADNKEGREKALAKLLPFQKSDFIGIFKEMKGLPVTVRLLDPPLHEFLPHTDEELQELSSDMGVKFDKLKTRNNALHEFNPMLGHRGCRLGITYPEIYEMQVRAIMEAACELKKQKVKVSPEIMIPLVGHVNELKSMREMALRVADEVQKSCKIKVDYSIGTMIEVARAAITADEIATQADFFSFGTNDLTQTTFGLSRDDAGRFLPVYVEQGILEDDPFITLDQDGVGQLMKLAVEKGRKTKKGLKMGICGEHGGEPKSVEFCHRIGLNYVSCSPFRVPIAKLAAAQAAVKGKTGTDLSKSTV